MKDPIENNWRNQLNDPDVMQDMIPDRVKQRIESKLFPAQKVKFLTWRTAISHAAALILGILATWFIVSYHNDQQIIDQEITNVQEENNTKLPTDIQNENEPTPGLEKTDSVDHHYNNNLATSTNTIDFSSDPNRNKATNQSESDIIKKDKNEHQPIIVHNTDTAIHQVEKPKELQEESIANVSSLHKQVIPVTDIAPIHSSKKIVEKIIPERSTHTASNHSSPFKIFNR